MTLKLGRYSGEFGNLCNLREVETSNNTTEIEAPKTRVIKISEMTYRRL